MEDRVREKHSRRNTIWIEKRKELAEDNFHIKPNNLQKAIELEEEIMEQSKKKRH